MATETHPAPYVREAYVGYTPLFDVTSLVRELLGYLPAEYLRGLKSVVLLNASGLSREKRRRRISSRHRKFLAGDCLGFYCRPRPGEPAYIGLHVDRLIQGAPPLALRVSIFRESLFAWTLYHEVGHHIHLALYPRHREPEDIADAWARRLRRSMLQQKYSSLSQEAWQRISEVAQKMEQRRKRASRALPAAEA